MDLITNLQGSLQWIRFYSVPTTGGGRKGFKAICHFHHVRAGMWMSWGITLVQFEFYCVFTIRYKRPNRFGDQNVQGGASGSYQILLNSRCNILLDHPVYHGDFATMICEARIRAIYILSTKIIE